MSTSLFGFTRHKVKPLGQINLPLSLGEEPLRKTRTMVFTVVEATFACNTILGRPTMNSFKVVTSTYHQKVMFLVGGQIGEVQGDQVAVRKCYVEIVYVNLKRAREGGSA